MGNNAQADQPAPFYSQPANVALKRLNAKLDEGLSSADAQKRLEQHGPNELPSGKKTPLWKLFLGQFNDFVVILLIVASLISIALGDLIEGLAIMAIVVLNAAIGLIQEQRADAALDALKKMAAPDAQVLRDGTRTRVPARDLVPGDIVFLEAGNYVPADLRLAESYNLQINESALTGESTPVSKRADEIIEDGAPIGDRVNTAYSSTLVTYGRGKGIVVSTGTHTEIGEIARMLGEIEEESTPLQKRLNQLGKTLSLVALVLCGMVFFVELFRNTDVGVIGAQGIGAYLTAYSRNITDFFILAVSLAVAAVPEGLAAVVTINLALGMREMVKRNALIRRLTAVETLGSATAICTDKTGTLTQNVMNVVRVYADGHTYRVTGDKYEPKGEFVEIRDSGKEIGDLDKEMRDSRLEMGSPSSNLQSLISNPQSPLSNLPSSLSTLLLGGLLVNDALLESSGEEGGQTTYRVVGDPTEGALVVAAAKAGLWRAEMAQAYPRIAEVPFDADRKMMTTLHAVKDAGRTAEDASVLIFTKGAPDIVLAHCTQVWRAGQAQALTEADRAELAAVNTAMASDALRVLAVALRPAAQESLPPATQLDGPSVEHDLIFVGLLGMIDPPRPEVIPAIQMARQAGIRTLMITGDFSVTARAIAQQIGLSETSGTPEVVAGAEIEAMSDEQLAERVKHVSVFARVSPEHKVRIVAAVKRIGNVVAMTGDGGERRAGAEEGGHRRGDGHHRDGREQGDSRHGADGRQLRQHREGGGAGTHHLREHPQVRVLPAGLQRGGDHDHLPGDAAGAEEPAGGDSAAVDEPGDGRGAGVGAGAGEGRPGHHAHPAAAGERADHQPAHGAGDGDADAGDHADGAGGVCAGVAGVPGAGGDDWVPGVVLCGVAAGIHVALGALLAAEDRAVHEPHDAVCDPVVGGGAAGGGVRAVPERGVRHGSAGA